MKKFILTTAFASVMMTGISMAQESPSTEKHMRGKQGQEQGQGQREKMTPDQQADRETARAEKELGLSADQKTKFRALALTRINTVTPLREKMRAPETTNAEQQTMRDQMKAARDQFDKDVNAMLTPEQQTKWTQMKENGKDKMKEHRGGNGKGGEKGSQNGSSNQN